jgi:hypothetical protein
MKKNIIARKKSLAKKTTRSSKATIRRASRAPARLPGSKKMPLSSAGVQCSLDSIEDLNPQNICLCARGLVELLAEARAMMEQPQKVVKSLMVEDRYQYGPKKIKGTPGWWFRAYRPELEITGSNKLKITVKAGVKKTRGALQFGWRKADHTFTVSLPPQYEQYRQLTDRIREIESQLNSLVTNVCSPLGY